MLDRRFMWVLLGLTSAVLPGLLGQSTIETYYSRGVFPYIRMAQDAISSLFPAALIYLLLGGLVLYISFQAARFFRRPLSWQSRLLSGLYSVLSFVAGSVFFFQVLWGWNYARIPVETQLKLDLSPFAVEELESTFLRVTDSLLLLRNRLQASDSSALDARWLSEDMDQRLRRNLKNTLEELGFEHQGLVRARSLHPEGVLLRFGTSGIYLPWTGEGHYDAGLHPLQLPFVIAHEMAHGYGFGDEGICNFWAYLTCMRSTSDFIRYAGLLGYWRYLASAYRQHAPDAYRTAYYEHLSPSLRSDLRAIHENSDRFPDLMPRFRNYAYESYLKAQGVEEGLKSYGRVVMLVHAWERSPKENK